MATLRRHRAPLLGLTFLAVLALLIALSIGIYRKALPWQHSVAVTLTTPAAGLQLTPPAEVKLDGLIVGSVRSVTSTGTSAVLHIALSPKDLHLIPANVDAEIIPKTLFGEKYVNLRMPPDPSSQAIAAGDQIRQSTTSIELSAVFNDIGPVLNTLQPQQLATTLSAISQALDGRGHELGDNIVLLHRYLAGLDPHLGRLTEDLNLLATTANGYAADTPALIKVLDNSRAISSQLLVPKEQAFSTFLQQTVSTASETEQVLRANAHDLITLAGRSRSVLRVLANFSSEYPCFIHSLYVGNGGLDHVYGGPGPFLKVSIDVIAANQPYSYPKDLPTNPHSAANNNNLPKGIPPGPYCTKIPSSAKGQTDAKPYTLEFPPGPTGSQAAANSAYQTNGRDALADALVAQYQHVPPSSVPGYASLLVAPTLGSGTVEVQ
jgi:phospholipid/cholesterol/gamma-HCH transport system substrate-binding protein